MDNKNKQVKQTSTESEVCKTKLPKGWSRHVVKRLQGRSEGKLDIYVYNPEGKKFRSKNEIATYLKRTGINNIDVDVFDFSTRNTTVVIPKGTKLVKPSPQLKAPIKRKIESPSVILTKKRKVENIGKVVSLAPATKSTTMKKASIKTIAERRASLTKFTASVKLDDSKSENEEDTGNSEVDPEPDSSNISEVFVEISDKSSDVMVVTLPEVSADSFTQSSQVENKILTSEEVKTDSKVENNIFPESTISEYIIRDEDESTHGSIQSISNIPITIIVSREEHSSVVTNVEEETVDSDVSEHVDETHLRLAMLQQMTALRRDSDISSEDDSSVQSTISEQTTATDIINLASVDNEPNGIISDIHTGICTSTAIVVTSEDDVNNLCQVAQLSPNIKNEKAVSSPQHVSLTPTNDVSFEEEEEEEDKEESIVEQSDSEHHETTSMKSDGNITTECIPAIEFSPSIIDVNDEMEISQLSKENSNDADKNIVLSDASDDAPPVSNETESDFVNGMLLPDKINLTLMNEEHTDENGVTESEENRTKSKEDRQTKLGNTSTNCNHEPFETEHAMVKKLLENNEVHLYKPALSEKIEEMLTDIDQEADEINQEAFVVKLGLEKIKEDSTEFQQETDLTVQEEEPKLKKTSETSLDKVDGDFHGNTESFEELEDKNNQLSDSDDEVPLSEPFSFERKEMPDITNVDNQDNICVTTESADVNEPSFDMPDIINIEKPLEEDNNIDADIRMPQLEPMVPTEIKKCDEPANYSLQKRVLIDWPAILAAVEENSDSDSSSSIDSYDSDSLNKSENESSSSNGDIPSTSKKIKMSPYFKNLSDNKKNIMKCKYFKTKKSDDTEMSDAKEIMKSINWVPPKSPYNLIQESLYQEPWKLLIATIFLNRTSGKVAIPLIWKFFDRWATPEAAYSANKVELAKFLQPMGLNNRRADQIMRFSYEFKHKAWLYPKELFGISKYGNDSFRIFCRNEWRKVKPLDHKLNMYHNWLCQNWKALGV